MLWQLQFRFPSWSALLPGGVVPSCDPNTPAWNLLSQNQNPNSQPTIWESQYVKQQTTIFTGLAIDGLYKAPPPGDPNGPIPLPTPVTQMGVQISLAAIAQQDPFYVKPNLNKSKSCATEYKALAQQCKSYPEGERQACLNRAATLVANCLN